VPPATHEIRAYIYLVQNMACGANISGNTGADTAGTAVLWYILHGSVFRVPLSTIPCEATAGGLGLVDVATKCLGLFLMRCRSQADMSGSLTARWIEFWTSRFPMANPLHITGIPRHLEFLSTYFQAWAYIAPQRMEESGKIFKKRMYVSLHNMARSEKEAPRMRVMTFRSAVDWSVVWNNFSSAVLPDRVRSMWYRVMHDILRTNVRMYRIHQTDTDRWRQCNAQDTMLPRLTESDESAAIWEWTRHRLALIQRIVPCHIPSVWLLFPQFHTVATA
jgi:hypothetical protein